MRDEWIDFSEGIRARVVAGDGPRLLWVHGYTLDARSWDDIWPLLPDCHHIGVELPGHGTSDPYDPEQTLPDLARLLGARALEMGVSHLVGLSFGGMVALQIALEFPDKFATLTLGSPGMAGGPQERTIAPVYTQLYSLHRVWGRSPALAECWLGSKLFDGGRDLPNLWARLTEIVGAHRWDELGHGPLWQFHRFSQRTEALARLPIQTRVLIGDHDLSAFKQIGTILQETLPHCEQRDLTGGVYHLCMLQRPAETADILREQLAVHPTGIPYGRESTNHDHLAGS